jgi:hypothetical protein
VITYSQDGVCPTDRASYTEGVYTVTLTNIADIDQTDDWDTKTVNVNCYASFVDIYKTTNGGVDPTKDIHFKLYGYDDEEPPNPIDLDDEVSTYEDDDGWLEFQTALVPGDTYTICEFPVPAGYTFEVRDEDGNVVSPIYPGPPGAENPTGEIQCFDFIAGDTGVTREFRINNSYPGGSPRTPGYWKNWNTCSGGKQADTAAHLGGVDENVFLLDDLLPQTIGEFEITTCEAGVLILDSRKSNGKNKSNDAAYTLAKALLAARLNQNAGACVAPPWDPPLEYIYDGETKTFTYFEEVLTAADGVLSDVGFDGTDDYLGPKNKKQKELAAYALWLYEIIDDYNNSELCTGAPSH